MNRINLACLAVLGALVIAGPIAYAAPNSADTTSVKVSTADLNLITAAGAKAMLSRLKLASQSICGPAPRSVDVQATDAYRACLDETLTRAVRSVNAPLVSVAFAESKG